MKWCKIRTNLPWNSSSLNFSLGSKKSRNYLEQICMHEYWCGSIAGYWVWSDNSPGIRWMECITHGQRWTRTSPWTSVQCPGLDLSDFHSAQGWDLAWSWSSASHVKLDLGTFNTHICIPAPDTDTWKGSFLEHVLQDDILIVNTNAGTTWWSHFSFSLKYAPVT